MKKKIAILGATGSIGDNLFKIIKKISSTKIKIKAIKRNLVKNITLTKILICHIEKILI